MNRHDINIMESMDYEWTVKRYPMAVCHNKSGKAGHLHPFQVFNLGDHPPLFLGAGATPKDAWHDAAERLGK